MYMDGVNGAGDAVPYPAVPGCTQGRVEQVVGWGREGVKRECVRWCWVGDMPVTSWVPGSAPTAAVASASATLRCAAPAVPMHALAAAAQPHSKNGFHAFFPPRCHSKTPTWDQFSGDDRRNHDHIHRHGLPHLGGAEVGDHGERVNHDGGGVAPHHIPAAGERDRLPGGRHQQAQQQHAATPHSHTRHVPTGGLSRTHRMMLSGRPAALMYTGADCFQARNSKTNATPEM